MKRQFAEMLAVGGKSNSLGLSDEVIKAVLADKSRLDELYGCLFNEDEWVRMRAADSLEKICRVHPDWLLPYVDRFAKELAPSTQPSVQWHLAQIYTQVNLTGGQKNFAVEWLKSLLSSTDVDWIVASNAMEALAHFSREGSVATSQLKDLLKIQQKHHSKAVVKRANKLLESL